MSPQPHSALEKWGSLGKWYHCIFRHPSVSPSLVLGPSFRHQTNHVHSVQRISLSPALSLLPLSFLQATSILTCFCFCPTSTYNLFPQNMMNLNNPQEASRLEYFPHVGKRKYWPKCNFPFNAIQSLFATAKLCLLSITTVRVLF